ncbi:MAG: aldo/keto reductase [Spongiibacteraceae bacterium]|jgi:aryl-alcohol dehydrogenase-like predicted oxidoreductase|nr:aldo/keto reductase [Spongiibacteraceae bacterium]
MQMRPLGQSGLQTAPLIFGGNVFGWTVKEPAAFDLIDAWLDAGFNAIDTADMYSSWVPGHQGGESETVLGNYFKVRGNRDRILLATKVGLEMPGGKGLSRKWIMQAVEDSLRRLQTEYIDLYQSHTDDSDTPLEETLEAYQRLIEQGKMRAIGASNYEVDRLAEALQVAERAGLPQYQTLQPLYNLYDRGFEAELAPFCQQHGVGVIPYFALASGFLSGKYRSLEDAKGRAREGMVGKYFNERGMAILDALDAVAASHQVAPAAVALAWLLAQPTVTAPIVSATSREQLAQLAEAARLQLTADELARLSAASADNGSAD